MRKPVARVACAALRLTPVAALLLPLLATAQEAAPQKLERVEVTAAQKTAVLRASEGTALFGTADRRDIPFSVNLVSGEEIRNRQVSTFSQALVGDPSVGNSYDDAIPYDTVSVRGFPISNLIVDGLVSWDAYTTRGVDNVERLEVLRGPAAFRYGFVAPGGVLNIVSKQAQARAFTTLNAGVSDRGRVTLSLDHNQPMSDTLALRVNAAAADGKLWMDRTEKRRRMLALAADWKPSPALQLQFGFEHDQSRAEGGGQEGYQDIGLDENGRLPAPIPDPRRQWQPDWAYSDIREQRADLRLRAQLAPEWRAELALSRGEKRIESWGGVTYNSPWQSNGDHLLSYSGYRWAPVTQLAGQVFVQGRVQTGGIGHQLTVGASASRFDGDIFFPSNGALPGVPSNLYRPSPLPALSPGNWDAAGRDLSQQQGVFVSDRLDLGRWHPLLGLRWSRIELESPWSNGKVANEKITPLAGLNYDWSEQLTVYASLARGLENGGRAPVGTVNALQTLPALSTRSAELGLKADLLGGSTQLDVALFRLQKPSAYTDASNRYVQAGEQIHRGLELMLKGRPQPRLLLGAGLTWIDAQLSGNPAVAGNRAENVPRLRAVASAEYQLEALPALTLTGLVKFNDRVHYNTPNRHQTEAYTLFNLGLRYLLSPATTVRLNVDNVADQRYWANALSWGGGRGAPRTAKVSVEWQL